MPLQLSLFAPAEPEFKNISVEWLLSFLNTQYPEMKFTIEQHYGWHDYPIIIQKMHKKIECYFHIGEYDKNVVTGAKNPNYIGFSYGKEYGDYHHSAGPIDTMEEFKKELPDIIKTCKKYVEEYKNYKKRENNESIDSL